MQCTTWLVAAAIVASVAACDSNAGQPQDAGAGKAAEKKQATAPTDSDPAIAQLDKFIAEQKIDKSAASWKSHLPKFTKLNFDAGTNYFVNIQTNKGPIKIKFMPDAAPNHVSNFMYLARLGFYDDVIFHRVIKGFMAQGGDPTGTGSGGPGYKFEAEIKAHHDKPGMLSTANAGPGTDGSQFFITFAPRPDLDGANAYTVLGEVVEGQDTLKAIEALGKNRDPAPPSEKVVMTKVTIETAKK
ncbi:MAG: peptidylprolyl isomerase [Planctomycetes bacterium]|nr:peptidylprolyl isomerase [Planctomycetota bacterium]